MGGENTFREGREGQGLIGSQPVEQGQEFSMVIVSLWSRGHELEQG